MTRLLVPLASLALLAPAPALAQASAAVASGKVAPSALSPGEIVAAAPASEWVRIAPSDLLVMDLAPPDRGPGQASAKGKPRRVVIQLMPPPFSQGWIGNIRKLAAAHWWDGLSVNRVQDNYVAQWGDADGEDKAKAKALPAGLQTNSESEYETPFAAKAITSRWEGGRKFEAVSVFQGHLPHPYPAVPELTDPYAKAFAFAADFPVAMTTKRIDTSTAITVVPDRLWPIHCYGMVGVGRDLSPNTGSGAELYAVIGHAPRHLDRNIALVGRVIEGIEHLSSLPRGTGALGFYETREERTTITSIRLGNEVVGLPAYEYLSTESTTFARYAGARANRRDPFFIKPAGGADVCNVPVPVRRAK